MLRLVPFNNVWVASDKLDLHAIYRRPHLKENDYGEYKQTQSVETGLMEWDLTGPLPVRGHNKWLAKGMEYVTLADKASLIEAARAGTILDQAGQPTPDWKQYDQHVTGGPWNFKLYQKGMAATATLEQAQLKADVERFGSEAVETIRRQRDPNFALPPELRNVPIGGLKALEGQPKGADGKFVKKAEATA